MLLLLIGLGAGVLWSGLRGGTGESAHLDAEGFNILLITMDTTRADYIGCYGSKTARTPTIDRLAAEGTLFRNCTTCTSLTTPSHASIMTALYPFVHGVRNNGARRLAVGCTTLAEVLKDAGYATGAEIASAVLDRKYGLDQGFDTYQDVPSEGRPTRYPQRRGDDICDAALEQLHSLAESKFFLWVHFYDPHDPYDPPGFTGGDTWQAYAAEITFMDTQIGRLIDELDRLQLDRNTLVVLVGDHGEGLTDHGEGGHGYFVYDTTLRAPLILRCPGTIPARRVIDARVRTIDVFPTLLELVGVAPPANVQGESLVPFLSGDDDLGLAAYGEALTAHLRFGMSPLRSLTVEGWKYVLAPTPALYDLASDPHERHNLIEEHPGIADDMREQLRSLIAEAPPPPPIEESTVTLSAADQARLESLGYAGGAGGGAADEQRTEMDLFEPQGPDPRNHLADINRDAAAVNAIADRDYPRAEQLLRSVVSAFPDAVDPLADLARAVARQGRTREACELLRRAVELDPDDDETRKKLARMLIKAERWAEAEEELEILLVLSPDDVAVSHRLGLALIGQERFEEAIEVLERARQIDAEDVRPVRGIGLALCRQRKFAEAEKLLRQALDKHPDSASLRSDLAFAVQEQGRTDEAVELHRRAVELDPDDTEARKSFGRLLLALERWDKALDQFTSVLERSPYDADALYHRARAAAKLNHNDEALADYERARRIDPDALRVLHGMGLVLIQMDRFARAEDILQDAAVRHPDSPLVLGDLAYARQMQGRLHEAHELYREALLLAPDSIGVRARFGILFVQLRRWDQARVELTRVIENAPDHFEARYNLGQALAQLGHVDQARDHFDHALSLNPNDVRVLHALGVLYARQKRFPEAADYFRKALEINPTHRKSQHDLNRVLQMMERK